MGAREAQSLFSESFVPSRNPPPDSPSLLGKGRNVQSLELEDGGVFSVSGVLRLATLAFPPVDRSMVTTGFIFMNWRIGEASPA